MDKNSTPPSIERNAFHCPHCGVFAQQFWDALGVAKVMDDQTPKLIQKKDLDAIEVKESLVAGSQEARREFLSRALANEVFSDGSSRQSHVSSIVNLNVSRCNHCRQYSVWLRDKLLHPRSSTAAKPNEDLPNDIREDFEEARSVLDQSPRAAAALLRLCIQKLCKELGEDGKNINADIGSLVEKGLDDRIQKALDVVRVNGNRAVHPSEMDDEDRRETAVQLFGLVNMIADEMITRPKRLEEMYAGLPEAALSSIERRDGGEAS